MPVASLRSFIGFGKETVVNTPVAATLYVPFKGEPKPHDDLKLLEDVGMRGSIVKTYDHLAGPLFATYDFGGDVFADTIGIPLSMLGDVTVTGTYTGSGTTTLSSPSIVGATTISVAASIAASTVIQIGTGATAEIRTTSAVSGAGPYTLTVPALTYAHAAAQVVQPVQAPWSHAFAPLNSGTTQPPTWTTSDYSGFNTRQYAGSKFTEIAFKFAGDGLFEYAAKLTSLGSVIGTTPTASFTTVTPQGGWQGVVTIGGLAVTYIADGEIVIKRTVTPVFTADNLQGPYTLWAEDVEVSGKMTAVMEDETELLRYLNNTKPTMDILYAQGAGATATSVQLHMSKCAYTVAEINRGKKFVEIPFSFTADANTTDVGGSGGYSPILATIKNALPTGTFK